MLKVPFFKPDINEREIQAAKKVLKSGWLTSGKITQDLENRIKSKLGCKYAIMVNSCTSGIHLSLLANNLEKGDEVITSAFTWVSTIHNLYNLGLKIKFCDIDPKNYSISLEGIKKIYSKKTKCILVTHYGGNPTNIVEIIKFCKKKKIKVIEDAATAFGARIKRKYIGSFNNSTSVFSFYANKIITGGEGGVVTTNDKKIADKVRVLSKMGINKDPWSRKKNNNKWQYNVNELGFKYNITDIQSSIILEQLKKLDKIISIRKKIKANYDKRLSKLIEKNLIFSIQTKEGFNSSYYIYTICLNPDKLRISRNQFIEKLERKKISAVVHYIPANRLNFYKKKINFTELKNTNQIYKNILSLPFFNKISKKEINYICKNVENLILDNLKIRN